MFKILCWLYRVCGSSKVMCVLYRKTSQMSRVLLVLSLAQGHKKVLTTKATSFYESILTYPYYSINWTKVHIFLNLYCREGMVNIFVFGRFVGTSRPIFTSLNDVGEGMMTGWVSGKMASVRGVRAVRALIEAIKFHWITK